jgi:hypothetical protein
MLFEEGLSGYISSDSCLQHLFKSWLDRIQVETVSAFFDIFSVMYRNIFFVLGSASIFACYSSLRTRHFISDLPFIQL